MGLLAAGAWDICTPGLYWISVF